MEKYQFTQSERTFLENLPTVLAVYQFDGRQVYTLALSKGFCDLFGYKDKAEAYRYMEQDIFYNTHPDDVSRITEAAHRFIAESGRYEVIFRSRKNRETEYRIIHGIGKHIYTDTGVRLAYVSFTDEGAYTGEEDNHASSLNRALNNALHEKSILKEIHYDHLTGLPNLPYFFELAEAWKSAIIAEGREPALVYMDLNGMKYYNHVNGFAEGDKLLRAFSKLLSHAFGLENCCHIGADRFAVYTKEEGIEETINRLFLEAKALNDGKSLPVRAGIYLNSFEDVPVSSAYDRAKIACDDLRKSDTSGLNFYSHALSDKINRRQYILANIDRAISENWIQVYYQPIVRSVNGRACDVEALARWVDPIEGVLSPGDFIPFLEDAGLIYKLDLHVLEQVLIKMNRVTADGLLIIPHSINLSRSDFDACDIVEEIKKRVDAAGVSHDKISIEITESVIGSDFDFMKTQVERFQKLGFPVWMDDFGSGYSSLDVLQSIKFDLLKFDMSFMRKQEEGENGKIILTELMKMANALGVDTICEGVETEEQVRFLQEIGCSKLQGYYYSKPVPYQEILDRRKDGYSLLPENPLESAYYDSIGRVNLYDLGVIANTEEDAFHNAFNMLPMGIIEVKGDSTRFVRSNQSYRDFIKRFFGRDLSHQGAGFEKFSASFMHNIVKTCCEQGIRSFYDEKMSDGSVVHSFARRIGTNPVTGTIAVAIAVLSVSDPDESTTYIDIARALAADYYNIYVVDLDTDQFIEYSSPVGGQEMAMERHGEDFFETCKQVAYRIYEEDRKPFFDSFSKEKIEQALEKQGVFTATYRLMDTSTPVYVNMKVTRMQSNGNKIIMGISVIDAQMKQKEMYDEMQKEREMLVRVMALSDGYLCLITVDPQTGRYVLYSSSDDFESLGASKTGDDLFKQAYIDAGKYCYIEDRQRFQEQFVRENVFSQIRQRGKFTINYRLVIKDVPTPVTLKAALFKEGDEEKLVVGVREWMDRK